MAQASVRRVASPFSAGPVLPPDAVHHVAGAAEIFLIERGAVGREGGRGAHYISVIGGKREHGGRQIVELRPLRFTGAIMLLGLVDCGALKWATIQAAS